MTIDAYDAVRTFIGQAAAHTADPARNPEPDPKLLLTDPLHGPITSVRLAGLEEHPLVAFSLHGRNERFLDPLDFAAITLATAFGMGFSVQDTGGAMAYPRFRVMKPKGRITYLLRVLVDAKPWEVARQCTEGGEYPEYHHLFRSGLSKHSVRRMWEEGKETRIPRLGRPEFYEAVGLYWDAAPEAAGIVSREDHLANIRTALELGDRRHTREDAARS